MYRVYFDSNNGNMEWGYNLNLEASRNDLALIGKHICNGLRVIIYMPDELEMEAEIEYLSKLKYWKAIPIEGTMRYYK